MYGLGRIPQFDEASRAFSLRKLIGDALPPRTTAWDCGLYLNQGQSSSCVGHGHAHALAAMPYPEPGVAEPTAMQIYNVAQTLDNIPGTHEGSTVLAGMKAVQSLYPALQVQYHWCFGIGDMLSALSNVGPVVIGINWYQDMFTPMSNGIVPVSGDLKGGHCLLATAIDVENRIVRLHNSWGITWGIGGDCIVHFADLQKLLSENGEAVVTTTRLIRSLI